MKPSRILVVGGSGFLGRHVAHRLSAAGIEVRIPTRNRELAVDYRLIERINGLKDKPLRVGQKKIARPG